MAYKSKQKVHILQFIIHVIRRVIHLVSFHIKFQSLAHQNSGQKIEISSFIKHHMRQTDVIFSDA